MYTQPFLPNTCKNIKGTNICQINKKLLNIKGCKHMFGRCFDGKNSCLFLVKRAYVSQHIKRDQMSQKNKMNVLPFPKWLFFKINFGAKKNEIRHCILEIWQFHWGCHNRLVNTEKLILRKRLFKFGNLYKVLVFWQLRGPYLHEHTVLHQILQKFYRLSIEDSKICEISKSTLGLCF